MVAVFVSFAQIGIFTQVGIHVAYISWLTVEGGVVTSGATSKTFTASAVETIVMSVVAHLVESFAHLVFCTDGLLALVGVQVAFIVSWAVMVVVQSHSSTPRYTLGLFSITVVAMALVGGRISHVAFPVVVVTFSVLCATTHMAVAGWVRSWTI